VAVVGRGQPIAGDPRAVVATTARPISLSHQRTPRAYWLFSLGGLFVGVSPPCCWRAARRQPSIICGTSAEANAPGPDAQARRRTLPAEYSWKNNQARSSSQRRHRLVEDASRAEPLCVLAVEPSRSVDHGPNGCGQIRMIDASPARTSAAGGHVVFSTAATRPSRGSTKARCRARHGRIPKRRRCSSAHVEDIALAPGHRHALATLFGGRAAPKRPPASTAFSNTVRLSAPLARVSCRQPFPRPKQCANRPAACAEPKF